MKEGQEARAGQDVVQSACEAYDVAIVGGGIAGLTLALELKISRPSTSILVTERQTHPVPEAAHKVGESTVEIAGYYLRDVLGLQEHLVAQQLPKFGLRMFFSADGNRDIARRVELGHAVLPPRGVATYQLDRGRLENALGEMLPEKGITFLTGCKVRQISLQPEGEFHRITLQHQGAEREIQARWVVDASGRSTILQRQLGLSKKVDHKANAVWFRIGHPIDINEWSTDPEWLGRIREGRRMLSTNHLMGPGYWMWLIPLASGSTSVGIVTDANMHRFDEINLFERALGWLYRHEPQCAQVIERHRDRIQDFRVMKDYSYGCEQVFSDERWCLTGEAGVSLDPLYSPGGDLIAIANGLVCDLIGHALDGEDIEERAAIHNQVFLTFTESWRTTYSHQYPIMGNAQIMAAKVIWDTAVYWAVPGLLYFHDKIRQLAEHMGIFRNLARFMVLSERVQAFFREWWAVDECTATDAFIKYYDFDFASRLQIGMTAGLDDAALDAQFAANVLFLERMGGQLVSTVMEILAERPQSEAIQRQVEEWKADEYLGELIARYKLAELEPPIDSGWITLGRAQRSPQEVVA